MPNETADAPAAAPAHAGVVAVPGLFPRHPDEAHPAGWTPLRRRLASTSLRRLACMLSTYRAELRHLAGAPAAGGEGAPPAPDWYREAVHLLGQAAAAVEEGDAERGWKCYLAAQRLELFGLAEKRPEQLEARALAILYEGADKLSGWRRRTVLALLADPSPGDEVELRRPVGSAEVHRVHEASLVLHEHYANEYAKLRDHRNLIAQLAAIGTLGVLGWLALVLPLAEEGPRVDFTAGATADPDLVLAVLVSGLLGACFSGLLPLFGGPTGHRIPRQLLSRWMTLGRLAAGAIAALAAQALLASGLLPLRVEALPWPLVVVAFAAGFSERLVVRAVDGIGGEGRKQAG
jgi:hypothetical protein